MHKWRPKKYSFVFVLIRPTSLVLKEHFFCILSVLTRLVSLISTKTKEYFFGRHLCIPSIYRQRKTNVVVYNQPQGIFLKSPSSLISIYLLPEWPAALCAGSNVRKFWPWNWLLWSHVLHINVFHFTSLLAEQTTGSLLLLTFCNRRQPALKWQTYRKWPDSFLLLNKNYANNNTENVCFL